MLTFRPAKPAEADLLSALALRSKAHWGYSPEFLQACKDELTYTADEVQSDRFLFVVAEMEATRAGFYALTRLSRVEVEFEALFVDPAFIGRGYGRALMDHAKTRASSWGASRMIIQGDPNAEAFYRAAGGVLSGRRESGSIRGRYLPLFTIDLRSAGAA